MLAEDDQILGAGHNLHSDIAQAGRGRYSHWGRLVIFSASDNSDPRTNGRRYTLHRLRPDETGTLTLDWDPILVLRPGWTLRCPDWMTGVEGFFGPPLGGDRPAVNPGMPMLERGCLHFPFPGEYYLKTPALGPLRLLVLDADQTLWPRRITAFLAANISGGTADQPDPTAETSPQWSILDGRIDRLLFRGDGLLHYSCFYESRAMRRYAEFCGMRARLFKWFGDRMPYDGHLGVEVRVADREEWVYCDPHFGLVCDDPPMSGLDAAVDMAAHGVEGHAHHFNVLVNKGAWARETLQPAFRALRCAVGFPHVPRGSRVIYQTGPNRPVRSAANATVRFLTGIDGLRRFRRLYYRVNPRR